MLEYSAFLATQTVYDDYKHANFSAIRFEFGAHALTVAQDRRLGRGGMVFDAAFVLADFVLSDGDAALRGRAVLELDETPRSSAWMTSTSRRDPNTSSRFFCRSAANVALSFISSWSSSDSTPSAPGSGPSSRGSSNSSSACSSSTASSRASRIASSLYQAA